MYLLPPGDLDTSSPMANEHIYNKWLRPIQANKNSHKVSIHVGVIEVRTQFFVLIYEFILIPPNNCIY